MWDSYTKKYSLSFSELKDLGNYLLYILISQLRKKGRWCEEKGLCFQWYKNKEPAKARENVPFLYSSQDVLPHCAASFYDDQLSLPLLNKGTSTVAMVS